MRQRIVANVFVACGLAACVACGGREPTPTGPSPTGSFLEGTWTGTMTIEREGQATAGPVSWTFAVVDGTDRRTFRVTIQSQHTWLPVTTTVTSAIEPT